MPFGAEFQPDGSARFRLWAPASRSVDLRIVESPNREIPMSELDGGWFETVIADAKSGTLYQFVCESKSGARQAVPDPASRYQPQGVHGPSELIDPAAFDWFDATQGRSGQSDQPWRGRPWEEAVIYELHIGTFTPEGTYTAAESKLDYLAELGVTAIELMPLSSFPGKRNWGYDGVLPFAPALPYGRPDDLKHFIRAAHQRGLMVFLDVVYNHFGPEGNYLSVYAPQFFTDRHKTPWGQAINYDGKDSRAVRDFFIHNALYWLGEYWFDGLRLDAVHAILDDSHPDILNELAATVRRTFADQRHVHLVLENDLNAARYLCRNMSGLRSSAVTPTTSVSTQGISAGSVALLSARMQSAGCYNAQWNDDIHHALQVLVTGEKNSYFSDYADNAICHLARCLTEGFSYQGEESRFRDGLKRGEISRGLPLTSFVSFLQNHDQIGNRAFGERITALASRAAIRTAMAVLLLAPSPPMLFMGEEFGAETPFLFFCDFEPDLAAKIRAGRRAEFPHFAVSDRGEIPDPTDEETFLRSKLDWDSLAKSDHAGWLKFYRELLICRRREIVPRLKEILTERAMFEIYSECALLVRWPFAQGGGLELRANFGEASIQLSGATLEKLIYSSSPTIQPSRLNNSNEIPPLTAFWVVS